MPYTDESNSEGTGRREQEQTWKDRNSDFRNTFEGARTESPPNRTIVEYDLPKPDAERPGNREDPEGVAERHEHDWNVDEPDWEVEP